MANSTMITLSFFLSGYYQRKCFTVIVFDRDILCFGDSMLFFFFKIFFFFVSCWFSVALSIEVAFLATTKKKKNFFVKRTLLRIFNLYLIQTCHSLQVYFAVFYKYSNFPTYSLVFFFPSLSILAFFSLHIFIPLHT